MKKQIDEMENEMARLSREIDRVKTNPLYKLSVAQRKKLHRQIEKTIKAVTDKQERHLIAELNARVIDLNAKIKQMTDYVDAKLDLIDTLTLRVDALEGKLGSVDAIGKEAK